MNMTELSFKSLIIICANPGITITEFSKKLWVDNPSWDEARQDGKGKGYKVIRMGQDYLGRLLKTGWVEQTYRNTGISKSNRRFYITKLGMAAMLNWHAKTTEK